MPLHQALITPTSIELCLVLRLTEGHICVGRSCSRMKDPAVTILLDVGAYARVDWVHLGVFK